MKTIVYFILTSLLFSVITYRNAECQTGYKTVMVRPVSGSTANNIMTQSANIISGRLKTYGIEGNTVTALADKGQIKVQLPDNYALPEIEGLLTLRGDIAFYETYNRKEVSDILKDDNHLFQLLNSDPGITPSESRLGCINAEKRSQVNVYLKNLKNPVNCKFFWSYQGFSSDESLRCLFALKTNPEGKPLLTRKDVETAKDEPAKDGKSINISLIFTKSAAGLWAEATRKNMNRAIAITVDNYVFYSPVVRSVIEQGLCEISGNMGQKEIKYFLAFVKNDPLPTVFEIVK